MLYYTPPTDDIFEEVRANAIKLWTERYPEETSPFYAAEKVARIKDIPNVGDNLMYIVSMFDDANQAFLATMLSEHSRSAIRERLEEGGTEPFFNHF